MTLNIQAESSEPSQVTLLLDGKLDATTSPTLDQFISDSLSPSVQTLVFDLQKLSFVSSAGLRVFAKARKTLKARSGNAYFVNLSPQVKRVFEIVKAVPVSEVFQDVQEFDAYLAAMQKKVTEA